MSDTPPNTTATVISTMHYRNAPTAIKWLCDVFGFSKHMVVDGPNGTVSHAELTFGNGMIMLSSVREKTSEFGKYMKQPDEIGGAETQSVYLIVSDADVVHKRAKAAGAKIAVEIKDEDYAGGASPASIWKATSGA